MVKTILFAGLGFILDVHGRRIVLDTNDDVTFQNDLEDFGFLEQAVARAVTHQDDQRRRRGDAEALAKKSERAKRKAARAETAANPKPKPAVPTAPPKHQPPSLEGYGVLEDRKCGGSWIETWSDGAGTGYGLGSKGNFAGCKAKCDKYKECAGFFYSTEQQVCSHYRKNPLKPTTAEGFNCFYKKSAYSPPVHQPHLNSVSSGITVGAAADTVLHHVYPHQAKLMDKDALNSGLSKVKPPTKGEMGAVVGDAWEMQIDLSEAEALSFLPAGEPSQEREGKFKYEVKLQVKKWAENDDTKRKALFAWQGWYWTGKLFQKVGMVCLLSEKYFGIIDPTTQKCAKILESGFKCLYGSSSAGKFGKEAPGVCRGKPSGHYYSKPWGGITSQYGYDSLKGCRGRDDFGNACFNDHHYHYGYMVVSGAILAKLMPKYQTDPDLKDFISTLIRDTTNPSVQDKYFSRFRHFDWFDMHSWSRGIAPNEYGKDQESVSEELNLFWGIHLWGGVTGDAKLQRLGTTMLALAVNSAKEYFFTLSSNKNHYGFEKFTNRHVPGIFFQTMVTYTTWFCQNACRIGIHAIQMMPLTPALPLVRTKEFCEEEERDSLQNLKFRPGKTWESVHITGSKAFLDPEQAYQDMKDISSRKQDDGLTKTWALYWIASRPGAKGQQTWTPKPLTAGSKLSPSASVLGLVNGGKRPNTVAFEPVDWHLLEPSHNEHAGPKATNKFWSNWVVDNRTIDKGSGVEYPIFPMPYVIKWGKWSARVGEFLPPTLEISRSDPEFGYLAWAGRKEGVPSYSAKFVGQFSLSAKEGAHGGGHIIIEESVFGIVLQVRGPPDTNRHITFPIFSGIAYVSGRYSGFTPVIGGTNDRQVKSVNKVRDGIWSVTNDGGVEFRVYVLDPSGNFIGSSFDFNSNGVGNSKLDGWMRMAEVREAPDTKILDAHARAIVVGMDLDVLAGGTVKYTFKKAQR